MVDAYFLEGLCHRKRLMLFSLKFQRNNRQNTLAKDSAKGKTGEKGCIFTILWGTNKHILCPRHLLYIHNMVNIPF